MCGEKTERVLPGCIRQGSPPRVRGKVQHLVDGDGNPGITPACAGKSDGGWSVGTIAEDHPRVCGEKPVGADLLGRRVGSPPRVRGKGRNPHQRWNSLRITPACAGKRLCGLDRGAVRWDHPRVCGEKLYASGFGSSVLGSPPRVRGKVRLHYDRAHETRITPACAGKRGQRVCPVSMGKDHPRVCGEKADDFSVLVALIGSPPRVRGKGR